MAALSLKAARHRPGKAGDSFFTECSFRLAAGAEREVKGLAADWEEREIPVARWAVRTWERPAGGR
jgi:hypothetical protein